MAVTRLADVIEPEVFFSYTALNLPELTAFAQSGIVRRSALLDGIARSGGKTGTLPFWQDLDPNIEANYSNDDPADMATPTGIGTGSMQYRKAWVNKGWGSMDLIQEIIGEDPMRRISNRTNVWWARQWQRRVIAQLRGLYASNVAKNGGDMVTDGTGELFNDAVIEADTGMGDYAGNFTAIIMHPRVRGYLLKQDQIETIPPSNGSLRMEFYKGLRVIVDDNAPTLSAPGTPADEVEYLVTMLGSGFWGFGSEEGHAFALGEGLPRVPFEIDRTPRAGNGGGMEEMWQRKTWLLHPFGFSWVEPTGANALVEMSPTWADLAKAAVWERVVERKQAPMAFIKFVIPAG